MGHLQCQKTNRSIQFLNDELAYEVVGPAICSKSVQSDLSSCSVYRN